MYTVEELLDIVNDTGLEDALKDISHESIEDPTLREYWEEARVALEKIEMVLDGAMDVLSDTDSIMDDVEFEDDEAYE